MKGGRESQVHNRGALFPILFPILIRSRFQANPQTLLVPNYFLTFPQECKVLRAKMAPFPQMMLSVITSPISKTEKTGCQYIGTSGLNYV